MPGISSAAKVLLAPIQAAVEAAFAVPSHAVDPVHLAQSFFESDHIKFYDHHSFQEKRAQYRQKVGIEPGAIFNDTCKDAFLKHNKEHAQDVSAFAGTITGFDPTKAPKPYQKKIADALAADKDYEKAMEVFTKGMNAFDRMSLQVPIPYSVAALERHMSEVIDNGVTAIEKHHEKQIQNLEAFLNNPKEVEKAKKNFNLDDEQVNKLKEQMLAALKEQQKKELETFKEPLEEAKNKFHKAAAADANDEQALIQMLYNADKRMREKIDALARGQAKKSGAHVVNHANGIFDISGVKLEDLDILYSVTGSEIKQSKVNNEDVLSLTIPSRLFGPLYHGSMRQNAVTDFMLMATTLRAKGHEAIKFTLKDFDEESKLVKGREAYIAGIRAGLAPDKIRIFAPAGNLLDIDKDLFKTAEQKAELQFWKQQATKITAELNAQPDQKQIQQQLSQIKTDAAKVEQTINYEEVQENYNKSNP